MMLSVLFLSYVTLQRLAELVLARRNTQRLLARGAFEVGQAHYPVIVGLHAGWIAALWAFGWNRPADLGWIAVYAALQALRVWTLASLGERWTTRILILPGVPLVRRGPYRWLPHPNYLVVVGEFAVAPMVFHLPGVALAFSLLNASILWIRIRTESAALRGAGEA